GHPPPGQARRPARVSGTTGGSLAGGARRTVGAGAGPEPPVLRSMAFVVIYDASVLYPAPVRDLLLRLAQAGLFQARWSEHILDECFAALSRQRPDLPADWLIRTRELIATAVPDCLVEGYE